MLNALQPGTKVPIHRHRETSETVICLHGRMEVVIYDVQTEYQVEKTSRTQDVLKGRTIRELSRHLLCPSEGYYAIQLPPGTWHSVEVYEPSTIFEAKDGAFAPSAVEDVVMG